MAATGLSALIVLTVLLNVYSHSMLGVGDEGNNAPPTAMLMGLALWQFGLALLVEKPMQRWLERRRVWVAVITANGMAMTVYLWHQTALILAVVLALLTGVGLRKSLLSGSWWASRPLWIAVLMVILLPLLLLFLRIERAEVKQRPGGRSWVAALGALAAAAGIAGLVLQGFLPGSGPGGVAAIPLMLLGGGAMLLLRSPG
jgi:phosphoglycerol transferase MdoB-like AlkP superfamily enzyme